MLCATSSLAPGLFARRMGDLLGGFGYRVGAAGDHGEVFVGPFEHFLAGLDFAVCVVHRSQRLRSRIMDTGDSLCDLGRARCRTFGQFADFVGNDRKAAPLFPGPLRSRH